MNEHWYWQLARERQRELLDEAKQARLLREAGIQYRAPRALKVLGLVLLIVPFAVVLLRAAGKL